MHRMKMILAAIGKMKRSPEQQLFDEYAKRLSWKIEVKEYEAKKHGDKVSETAWLWAQVKKCHRIIALDETGELLTSLQFASRISSWQQQGGSSLGCIIGGADGLDHAQLKNVDLLLSMGRLTWPHMLVRPLLAEQLYRASTLIAGHPYHRQ